LSIVYSRESIVKYRVAKFTAVLHNRNFFLLWIGQIISQLGDRLDQMALIALVYAKAPGSSLSMAKTLSFTIIPVFLVGPIAGAYVDRWDRRRIMFISDFLRAGLVLCIAAFLIDKSLVWVYLFIFTMFSVGRFFVPAKLSIIPELVDKEHLVMANSLVNTTGMIAAVLGFGISGIVVEKLGAQGGFYLDAVSFLVSGACIFSIAKKSLRDMKLKTAGKELVEAIRQSAIIRSSLLTDIKEGFHYFFQKKDLRATAGIIFSLWSALGAVYVVIIVFVQKTLGSATQDLGLLIMFLGIGLFCGSLAYGHVGHRFSQYKIIFISLILSGIMVVAFALGITQYPNFAVAACLSLLLGTAISPIMIASNTIVHKVSENHMLGKTFSSLEIIIHLGFLIFMFVSSIVAEHIHPLYILVTVGCAVAILGTVQLVRNHTISWLD